MSHHQEISNITLGTVQLGIPYGIANKSGQPATADSHRLLQFALDHGINTLDTARIYGNAEEVIGNFGQAGQFRVVSKFKLSNAALKDVELATREARESLAISLRQLKTDRIDIYLFHKNADQHIQAIMRVLPGVLKKLREDGVISAGGISVYKPAELLGIRDWEEISAVQVPMNLLDTRLLQDGLLDQLHRRSVKVFIRSIYLQGLLLMKEEELPSHLTHARVYLQKINNIAKAANKSITDLAFSFVRDTPGVTSIVVGAETLEQLEDNIALASSAPLDRSVYEEIKTSFNSVPETLITPASWNR